MTARHLLLLGPLLALLGAAYLLPFLGVMSWSVTLPEPGVIEVEVINDGPDDVTIAQVLVDDAYWQFTSDHDGPLELRLEVAQVALDFAHLLTAHRIAGGLRVEALAHFLQLPHPRLQLLQACRRHVIGVRAERAFGELAGSEFFIAFLDKCAAHVGDGR